MNLQNALKLLPANMENMVSSD